MEVKRGEIITMFLEGYNDLNEVQYQLQRPADLQALADWIATLCVNIPFNVLQYKVARYLVDTGTLVEIPSRSPIVPIVNEVLLVAEPVYKESHA